MKNYNFAVALILIGSIVRFAFHFAAPGPVNIPLIGELFIGAGALSALLALAHDYMLSYGRGRVMRFEDND